MDVRILKQFASKSDVEELKEWVFSLRKTGVLKPNVMGKGRFYSPLGLISSHPTALQKIDLRLQEKFKIAGKCVELSDAAEVERTKATPSFVGMQLAGGFVQPHLDGNIGDQLQFRCTLLISKAEKGGQLVLANTEYDMEEGDIYCFVSNNTRHGTTPVEGDRPRMACSLGFLVDKSFRFDID